MAASVIVLVMGNPTRRWYSITKTITDAAIRSEEHTSELQSQSNLVCRLLLEKKKKQTHKLFPVLLSHLSHNPATTHPAPNTCKLPPYLHSNMSLACQTGQDASSLLTTYADPL